MKQDKTPVGISVLLLVVSPCAPCSWQFSQWRLLHAGPRTLPACRADAERDCLPRTAALTLRPITHIKQTNKQATTENKNSFSHITVSHIGRALHGALLSCCCTPSWCSPALPALVSCCSWLFLCPPVESSEWPALWRAPAGRYRAQRRAPRTWISTPAPPSPGEEQMVLTTVTCSTRALALLYSSYTTAIQQQMQYLIQFNLILLTISFNI